MTADTSLPDFSDDELLRYSRQFLLRDIGYEGQQRLKNSCVMIIGLGGLGCPASAYLAAAGVGHLILADADQIELTNLQRQILYRSEDTGQAKSQIASERLQALNPSIKLTPLDCQVDEQVLEQWIDQVDLVLDCTDNLGSRHAINRVCKTHNTPLVVGAAIGLEGQFIFFDQQPGSPCYECLVPASDHSGDDSCATSGVLGPVLGMIASLQALTSLRFLAGKTISKANQLQRFDAYSLDWQTLQLPARPDCPTCSAKA